MVMFDKIGSTLSNLNRLLMIVLRLDLGAHGKVVREGLGGHIAVEGLFPVTLILNRLAYSGPGVGLLRRKPRRDPQLSAVLFGMLERKFRLIIRHCYYIGIIESCIVLIFLGFTHSHWWVSL